MSISATAIIWKRAKSKEADSKREKVSFSGDSPGMAGYDRTSSKIPMEASTIYNCKSLNQQLAIIDDAKSRIDTTSESSF